MRVVILGGGPGGYTAAVRAAQNHHETTLIEAAHLGGTCLNQGCIPSKIFRRTADMADDMASCHQMGFEGGELPKVSMGALQKRKSAVIQSQRRGLESLMKHHGIQVLQGHGSCEAPGKIRVATPSGESVSVPYDRLIIAAGSVPVDLPHCPADGETVLTSDHLLDLETLPASALVVGGGVIGCEFAFILSSFGVKVSVVEAKERVLSLPGISKETSRLVETAMKKRKIKPLCGRLVRSIEKENGLCHVHLESAVTPGKEESVAVEKVFTMVGRSAASKALGLDM